MELQHSSREKDLEYMNAALALARKAGEMGEIPVGAVVVYQDRIIGEGYNGRETLGNPLAHAEIAAIHQACQNRGGWRLSGCTLYVTLEPCPMCAGAIINARIDRVVWGADDPKAGSCGSLINLFALGYNHPPLTVSGGCRGGSAQLLQEFFSRLRQQRKQKKERSLP